MSKNKLLIYLLSTTLVFPTFTTPTAVAKDNTDDINQQTKVTHKVHSRKKINKSKLIAINVRIKQKKLLLRNLLLKRTVNLLKRIIKIMMLKRIKTKHLISQIKILTSSIKLQQQLLIKISKNTNLVDQFYHNVAQSQSHMNDLLKPDKYDHSFSLTTLIQNLLTLILIFQIMNSQMIIQVNHLPLQIEMILLIVITMILKR